MPVKKEEIENLLQSKFLTAKMIKISDFAGDGNHYNIEIIDDIFKNIPLIKQHRMIQDALKDLLKERLHAVTIKTSAFSN